MPRPAMPLLWAVLIAVAASAVAAGPPATTSVADGGTTALVRQLGADDEADRSAAQRQLVDLGVSANDALRRAAETDADPEVRSRAASALAEIADREASGPTLITLHVHGAAAADVLATLGERAHADIAHSFFDPAGAPPVVTIDADRRPFWDVMADVCGQTGLCPLADDPDRRTVRLVNADRNWITAAPHAVVGPFWVGVTSVYRMSSVDLAGPAVADDHFLARLMVLAEPKLVVTQVSPLAVREATDNAGHSLAPPGRAGGGAARPAASRLPARTVEARLVYPADHPGTRIATLAGDLTVTLAQGARRFEADDVLGRPTVTRPVPGVHVRVAAAKLSPDDLYQVTVECVREGLADAPWSAMVNRVADVSVEDAAGHALSPLGWTTDAGNGRSTFKATGLFSGGNPPGDPMLNQALAAAGAKLPPAAGPPRRVVWAVADRFKVVTVPVAFHDLPMP